MTGCQALDLARPTADVPAVVEAVAPVATEDVVAVDPGLVDDFRRWLDQEAWQVDLHWSVLDHRAGCPNRLWRYTFVPADDPQAAPSPTNKPPADGRWEWLWAGDAAAAREDERAAAIAALRACRKDGSRVGVHADILLARLQADRRDDAEEQLRSICEQASGSAQVVKAGAGIDSGSSPKSTSHRVALSARCAAAEAWCARLAAAGEPYDAALLPAGRLLQTPGLPDELRGTLWRSLSRWLPPDQLPMLAATCASLDSTAGPGTVLQKAALEACVIAAARTRSAPFAAENWPQELERARRHGDPHIRRLYGRWLAWSGHPSWLTVLQAQRHDTDALVKEAAIVSLGLTKQDTARATLTQLAQTGGDRDRAAAVEALAAWGATALEPFVAAESPAVRCAVARGLTPPPEALGTQLLERLLHDRHPDVQTAALTTATHWPPDHAIPALLAALRVSSLAVRQNAVLALRELTHEDPPVSVDGLPEERDAAVRQWAASRDWNVGGSALAAVASTSVPGDPAALQGSLQAALQSPTATLARDVWDELVRQARPSDVPAIERALLDSRSPAVETLRQELLPRLDDSYAALKELTAGDVQQRREAARKLRLIAQRRTLSPALLRSVHAALVIEQDQQVWQHCLEAVQADGHEEAAQLALLAVNHAWPDVRRLGVAYIAAHPTPEAAGWLLPLFHDESRAVQQAAIAAAAKCGNPVALDGYPAAESGQQGLRSLLPTVDHELRWTLLSTMAALRDDQAAAELIRLSYDAHPRVREQAAKAMGDSGDGRFVEALIRWSWTEAADPVKHAILDSLDTLTPVDDRPGTASGLAAPPTIDDKIKQWAAWWEHHAPRTDAAPRTAASESRPPS